jgi:hypothetical protein
MGEGEKREHLPRAPSHSLNPILHSLSDGDNGSIDYTKRAQEEADYAVISYSPYVVTTAGVTLGSCVNHEQTTVFRCDLTSTINITTTTITTTTITITNPPALLPCSLNRADTNDQRGKKASNGKCPNQDARELLQVEVEAAAIVMINVEATHKKKGTDKKGKEWIPRMFVNVTTRPKNAPPKALPAIDQHSLPPVQYPETWSFKVSPLSTYS